MIDTTQDFIISGPGGGSSAPSTKLDTTMEMPFGGAVSANDSPGKNNFPSVSKPETAGKVNSVFFEPIPASPASIDSTFEQVLEQINFDRK